MTTVRDVLNRLRWDAAAQRPGVVVEVRTRERGSEKVAVIAFDSVVEILPQGVTVAGDTFLPYHRFVRVRCGQDVLWPPTEGTAS